MFQPYQSDWCYYKVDIENLQQIQQESVQVFNHITGGVVPDDPEFKIVEDLESQTPLLRKYLDSIGLSDRQYFAGLVISKDGSEFPIHVDNITGADRFVALNIPLINCDCTYTAWYDANITQPLTEVGNYAQGINSNTEQAITTYNGLYYCTDAVEIARTECNQPMLAHVGRPHRGIVEHQQLRVLMTVRFRPELSREDFKRFQLVHDL
jgi:hypothetical protein